MAIKGRIGEVAEIIGLSVGSILATLPIREYLVENQLEPLAQIIIGCAIIFVSIGFILSLLRK